MSFLPKLTSCFLLLFALINIVYTTPVTHTRPAVEYPEVIPGPGLPSLESLNLTSTLLYEMPFPDDSAYCFFVSSPFFSSLNQPSS
jgi:hypothetical protein